jgi:hypothetical protein
LRNHARTIVACDFFVAVTVTFRILYVFVLIEHGNRRLAHVNVTAHPTVEWTLQQLREAINEDRRHERLIHDRDRIYSKQLDGSIETLGLEVLRSPIAAPQANSICERVIGTIRRKCLDWMIPMSEGHLRPGPGCILFGNHLYEVFCSRRWAAARYIARMARLPLDRSGSPGIGGGSRRSAFNIQDRRGVLTRPPPPICHLRDRR